MKPFAEDSRPIASQGKAELARETEKVEIFFDSIYTQAPPISFQPTPAVEQGRLPWCLKCECVELADPSPGSSKSTVPQRVSLGWVVQVSPQPELLPLDLLKTENRNNRLGNTETLVYTTLVGSHAHSLK